MALGVAVPIWVGVTVLVLVGEPAKEVLVGLMVMLGLGVAVGLMLKLELGSGVMVSVTLGVFVSWANIGA